MECPHDVDMECPHDVDMECLMTWTWNALMTWTWNALMTKVEPKNMQMDEYISTSSRDGEGPMACMNPRMLSIYFIATFTNQLT